MNSCPKCKKYIYGLDAKYHVCPPTWRVRIPEWEGDNEDLEDWIEIKAGDEEQAACQHFEDVNDEYHEGPIEVHVAGEDGIVKVYECFAEPVMTYSAHLKK